MLWNQLQTLFSFNFILSFCWSWTKIVGWIESFKKASEHRNKSIPLTGLTDLANCTCVKSPVLLIVLKILIPKIALLKLNTYKNLTVKLWKIVERKKKIALSFKFGMVQAFIWYQTQGKLRILLYIQVLRILRIKPIILLNLSKLL